MSLKVKAVLVTTVAIAAIVGATALEIWLDYRTTRAASLQAAQDITRLVERHVRDTLTYVEQTLDSASELVETSATLDTLQQPEPIKLLRSYCNLLIGCRTIVVLSPEGRVVADALAASMVGTDVSDRTYFRQARDSKKMFIGPALVSRMPGNPIIFNVAKPVIDAYGRLVAVVMVAMDTEHLTKFYALLGFALPPTVTLFKGNGELVARMPDIDKHVGRSGVGGSLFTRQLPGAPQGSYESLSNLDGKRRLGAYRSIPDLDLVVLAGIETSAAFAPWRERAGRMSTIVGITLGLLLLAAFQAYRALSQQLMLRADNRRLDKLSNRDPLTGIGNRRLFDSTLRRDWGRHRRQVTPLSVLFIDVDCFKPFNDTYGHPVGDACLRQVAQVLESCIQRESDIVTRYGGEEFAALLECDFAGAYTVAERMRAEVEALAIRHESSSAGPVVTISIGIASTGTSAGKLKTAEELIREADTALYAAKEQGRNRVHPVPPAVPLRTVDSIAPGVTPQS